MDFAWILIVFCIIVNAFRTHACNKFCRLLTSLDTKRIDSKHQEHTDICRNMQESNGNKKRIHQNSDRYFAIYKMQSAATNADLQIRGRRCSRRMAHSDPPPPFGVQGVLDALSDSCQFLSDSKSLLWPPRGSCGIDWAWAGFQCLVLSICTHQS